LDENLRAGVIASLLALSLALGYVLFRKQLNPHSWVNEIAAELELDSDDRITG
jgi:hypothetical protein